MIIASWQPLINALAALVYLVVILGWLLVCLFLVAIFMPPRK